MAPMLPPEPEMGCQLQKYQYCRNTVVPYGQACGPEMTAVILMTMIVSLQQ